MVRRRVSAKDAPRARGERYHHGQLRAALVEAALATIEESGLAALTMRDLARRVGVSHSAPYRHFESRDAVLCEVAQLGLARLAAALRQAVPPADLTREDPLEAVAKAYVRFALGHRALFRLMFDAAARKGTLGDPIGEPLATLASVVGDGVEDGGAASPEARQPALLAWSLLHGLATLTLDERFALGPDPEALAIRAARVLNAGLREAPRVRA